MRHDPTMNLPTSSMDEAAVKSAPGRAAASAAISVHGESPWPPGAMGRRAALKLMAASTLLASGMPGCRRKPYRKIVSLVEPPEYQKPGIPVYYASTWTEGQLPYGMKVKAVDGRPVKVEGLPDHPLNRGTSSAAMQATILSLYDPERLHEPHRRIDQDEVVTWQQADAAIVAALRDAKRVVLVTRATLGPSEQALVQQFVDTCQGAQHLVHDTVNDGPQQVAWRAAFGSNGQLQLRLDKAKVIVSFDADFLAAGTGSLEATRQFAATRRIAPDGQQDAELSRLYVVEAAMSVTGSNADHRVPLRSSLMGGLVAALRAATGGESGPLEEFASAHHLDAKLLGALASDLKAARGKAVVLAGPHLPVSVHAAVALLNADLEALGKTLEWDPHPALLPVDSREAIMAAMTEGGGPDVLIFMGVNPGYDWPKAMFDQAIGKAAVSIGLGEYDDETLKACTFALPTTHNLESWNDAVPAPGMRGMCQPVIAPLFNPRQAAESLLLWTKSLGEDQKALADCDDWHDYLKAQWQKTVLRGADDAEKAWEDALRQGIVTAASETKAVSETKAGQVEFNREAAAKLVAAQGAVKAGDYELLIRPHDALLDGRFATNAWLQELPDPVSKLVWENAASVSPSTASQLGVKENDLIVLTARPAIGDEENFTLPVLVQPGMADGVVATTLGYGRTAAGPVAAGHGVNVAPLMGRCGTSLTPWLSVDVAVGVSGQRATGAARLVRTQKHFSMMDRPISLKGTLAQYHEDPAFVKHLKHVPPLEQIDPPYDYSQGHKWAMAIDQNACTGCSACMIACQAENNVPVVGKEECGHGREMHWIRIDRYEGGDARNPDIDQQPMLCQQCDNAPCENVCPVNATAHSPEGLNEQVYNRCVGTRYCANNCPYKVRRFNFFNYQGRIVKESVQELVFNPQVTVRSRGVMEKCTFCIQRINAVKFQAENREEPITDGEIQPACAQACPAQAIVFGDVNDPESRIAQWRASSLVYHVLEELNVRPNVAYLARVTNPHPDISGPAKGGDG